MKKIALVVAVASALVLSACSEMGYTVQKVLTDPDTGRSYVVCTAPGKPTVEYTVDARTAFDTKVGGVCWDNWVSHGVTITPSSTSTSQPPTT